jgi:hypothetical protein
MLKADSGVSSVELSEVKSLVIVRQLPASKDVNTDVEGSTALKPLPDSDW